MRHRTINILPVLLIVFAVSSYAQDKSPSLQNSNISPEKAGQGKWEVEGSIGNKVVIVNGRGDTSAVEVGSEIDGCLVTVNKVICDPALIHPLIAILESGGKTGYSPDLGGIKFVMADDKLIVRVDQGFSDRAKNMLRKAILEEVQDNGHVYYALDKNMVEVNYK